MSPDKTRPPQKSCVCRKRPRRWCAWHDPRVLAVRAALRAAVARAIADELQRIESAAAKE